MTSTAEPTPVQHDGPPVWTDERGVFCIRASGMGMCTRAMLAIYQGVEKMAPPEKMQQRFDDGHLHEASTLAAAAVREKVAIEPYLDKTVLVVVPGKVEIHGHVDGLVYSQRADGEPPNPGDFYAVAEAKAFSKSMYTDYLRKGGPGTLYGYGMQAKIYMLSLDVDSILYAVKNKDSGDVDVRWFKVNDPSLPTRAEIIKRAMEIYRYCTDVSNDAYTEICDAPMFPCPVFYLHENVAKVDVEDQVLKEMLEKYKTAQQQEVAAKAVKDGVGLEIADRLQVIGQDALTVLGWSVTAKVGETTGYDWATIEQITGRKKVEFVTKKPNSKATVTVTPPSGWTPGQTMLG